MANTPFNIGRRLFVTQGIHWVNDTIRAALVDTTAYTFDAAHEYLSQIPLGARLLTTPLVNRSVSSIGGCLADSLSLSGVTGSYAGAIVLYKVGGTEATSPLLVYVDTLPGLPFTPSGGAVLISFNTGAGGIFRA